MLGGGDQTLDWAGVPSWPEGWRLARGHPSSGARSEPEGAPADLPRSPGRPGAGATAPPPSLSGRSGAPGRSLGITPKTKRVRSLLRCTGGGRSSEETAFGGPPGALALQTPARNPLAQPEGAVRQGSELERSGTAPPAEAASFGSRRPGHIRPSQGHTRGPIRIADYRPQREKSGMLARGTTAP